MGMCCNSETQNAVANEKELREIIEPENPVVENFARLIADPPNSSTTEEDEKLFNEKFPLIQSNKDFVNVFL
jgi:hypothetical protein